MMISFWTEAVHQEVSFGYPVLSVWHALVCFALGRVLVRVPSVA
jgi:hypothetical protein